MRSGISSMVLLGVAISSVLLLALKGGKGMSLQHNDTDVGLALPSVDTHHSGTMETATFALG